MTISLTKGMLSTSSSAISFKWELLPRVSSAIHQNCLVESTPRNDDFFGCMLHSHEAHHARLGNLTQAKHQRPSQREIRIRHDSYRSSKNSLSSRRWMNGAGKARKALTSKAGRVSRGDGTVLRRKGISIWSEVVQTTSFQHECVNSLISHARLGKYDERDKRWPVRSSLISSITYQVISSHLIFETQGGNGSAAKKQARNSRLLAPSTNYNGWLLLKWMHSIDGPSSSG